MPEFAPNLVQSSSVFGSDMAEFHGVTSDAGRGYFHVGVSYGLSDDTVIAHKRSEPDIYYVLS